MRLMSFEHRGQAGYGIVSGNGIVDAGKRLGARADTLRAALAAGALPDLAKLSSRGPDLALSDVTFAPVIANAGAKLLCVGINYLPHIKEMGRERPQHPVLFVRFADSIVGHGVPMESRLPPNSSTSKENSQSSSASARGE